MHRVRLSGSMWTYELGSWVCDTPALGARVQFADLAEAERTLRWLLHEDPLAHTRVGALLRDLDGDSLGFSHADEHALLERAAWLLERGRLVLHRSSVELMASEAPTRVYTQEYEPPVNEIAEVVSWLFWDEFRPEQTLALDATHVGEPTFVLDDELGPGDNLIMDVELMPTDTLAMDTEVTDGNFVMEVEDEFGDDRRTVAHE
jgi:hypothetical protein